jgi:Domain of unknown function (DUF6259)
MAGRIFASLCFLAVVACCSAWCEESAAITYTQPPRCEVWLQGEDCTDHNWLEGPARSCWAFAWAGVHGGVLDLASWRLPEEGFYYARFPFEAGQDGTYVFYSLGRAPDYQGSPIEWSVDGSEPVECGPTPEAPTERLAHTEQIKYAVVRLGTAVLTRGPHTLTITVRKPAMDMGRALYSQQIDAIGIAPAEWPVVPEYIPDDLALGEISFVSTEALPGATEFTEILGPALTLELSPEPVGIVGLRLANAQKTGLTSQTDPAPLVEFEFLADAEGCSTTASARNASFARVSEREMAIALPGAVEAELRITTRANGELVLRALVTNNWTETVQRVTFNLAGPAIGGDASDDTWLVAQDTFAPGMLPVRATRRSPWPFSFDWVCVHDASATIYFRFEDKRLLDTEVTFGKTDASSADTTLSFSKFPRIRPGESWSSPPLVIGAYAGSNWHDAADRFSAWWHSWAAKPHIPAWAKTMGGMTLGLAFHDDGALTANADAIERVRAATGIATYHGSGWISGQTECWYPLQYRLSHEHLQNLRTATDATRKADARTSIYTNALMLSRAAADYELWGRDLAAIDERGGVWFTEHHAHHHPMMLPYPNAAWADIYCDIMAQNVVMGFPDMLYMDQLGAVPAHLDYAPDRHGHEHYGEWAAGSVAFVKTVRERFESQRPQLATCIECPAPALMQHVSFGLLSTSEVLRYVFPHYYGFVGPYGSVTGADAVRNAETAFLTGQPLLLLNATLEDASEAERQRVRELVVFKQQVDPLLYDARFRHTVGLDLPRSGNVRARVFVGADGVYIPYVADKPGVDSLHYDLPEGQTAQLHVTHRGPSAEPEPCVALVEDGGVWLAPVSQFGVFCLAER